MMNDIITITDYTPKSLSLNPLSEILNTIREISYYKQQIKILETEQLRINREAELRHHQIDAKLELELASLENHRVKLDKKLKTVAKNLKGMRLERKEIIKQMGDLTKLICNPDVSSEDKKTAHSTIAIYSETLKDMGNKSFLTLDSLMKETQIKIEPLQNNNVLKE